MIANIALAGYWLAVALLTACGVVIVLKLLFWPLCTPTGPTDNTCIVGDSWTIAGVTAAVLGVAAAMLTILGAFAVASWWSGWRARVETQVREVVEVLYAEQEKKVSDQVGQLLDEQKKRLDRLVTESEESFRSLKQEFVSLEERVVHVNKEMDRLDQLMATVEEFVFEAAMGDTQEYGKVKQWAETTINKIKPDFPLLAAQITLRVVDRVLSNLHSSLDDYDQATESERDWLFERAWTILGSLTPFYWWNELLDWKRSIENLSIGSLRLDESLDPVSIPKAMPIVHHIEQVNRDIELYRPRVEAWNRQSQEWKERHKIQVSKQQPKEEEQQEP